MATPVGARRLPSIVTPTGVKPQRLACQWTGTRDGLHRHSLRSLAMFKTKNDLSEEVRVKVIGLLNDRLADAIDLQTQTKQAHWNVKGPNFIALHQLFDKISEDAGENVDEIAERVVQLGGVA